MGLLDTLNDLVFKIEIQNVNVEEAIYGLDVRAAELLAIQMEVRRLLAETPDFKDRPSLLRLFDTTPESLETLKESVYGYPSYNETVERILSDAKFKLTGWKKRLPDSEQPLLSTFRQIKGKLKSVTRNLDECNTKIDSLNSRFTEDFRFWDTIRTHLPH